MVVFFHHLQCFKAASQRKVPLASFLNVAAPPDHHDHPLLEVIRPVVGTADLVVISVEKNRFNDTGVKALLVESSTPKRA